MYINTYCVFVCVYCFQVFALVRGLYVYVWWWCSCAGVFLVVWWCFGAGVFGVVSCGGVFVVVFLLLCLCAGVYSNITLYYKVLLQYYSVLQSTTPTSERMSERRPSSTIPYYASTRKASKTSISCEASATFQGTSFQNEHFVRCFLQFSQSEVPKRAFRAMLPTIFTEKASKRIVSCETSSKFHRRSFQNERFVRGFLQISQNHASKTSVSRDASNSFQKNNFQNDRFVRSFFQISQNHASKTSVSHDASNNFHRKSFQNDRFVRGFLQISQNNAPKTIVSRDASDNFHQRFAFRYSFA